MSRKNRTPVAPVVASPVAPDAAPPVVAAPPVTPDAAPDLPVNPRSALTTPDAAPLSARTLIVNGSLLNGAPGATPMMRALATLDRAPVCVGGDPDRATFTPRAALTLALSIADGALTDHADALTFAARAFYGPRALHSTTGVSDLTLLNFAARIVLRLTRYACGSGYRATPGRIDRTDDAPAILAHARARAATALAALPPV